MTLEEYNSLINEIRENNTDTGRVSLLLAKLSRDYEETQSVIATKEKENNELKQTNTNLLQANGELFLQVTSSKKETEKETQEEKSNNLRFEDLFDQNGNLK